MTATLDLAAETKAILTELGVAADRYTGGTLAVTSPVTGAEIGRLKEHSSEEAKAAIDKAHEAFLAWRDVPAPKRGELIRLLGEELRAGKAALGRLVSVEVGKITSEGLGEVQEMIDICDFAVGLSRQLYGLTIATERSEHRMMESWHPLGPIGIISAFNFPVAVWSWNGALAMVCGNSTIWKPSEKTPLTALAVQALFEKALKRYVAEGGGAGQSLDTDHRRSRPRRTAGRSSEGSSGLGDRIDGHGPRRRSAPRRPVRTRHPRARRQQCRDRLPDG